MSHLCYAPFYLILFILQEYELTNWLFTKVAGNYINMLRQLLIYVLIVNKPVLNYKFTSKKRDSFFNWGLLFVSMFLFYIKIYINQN